MSFIPAWAPNIHPLIIHFPIAILILAVAVDFASLFLHRYAWLRYVVIGLFTVGAVGAIAAVISGDQAAETVMLTSAAEAALEEHEELGELVMTLFVGFALIRVAAAWWDKAWRHRVHVPLFILGLLAMILLVETGDHGGMLVYRYGVGVETATQESAAPHDHGAHQHDDGDGDHETE